jgi:predicted DNA-binding transcriptional regulator YafY
MPAKRKPAPAPVSRPPLERMMRIHAILQQGRPRNAVQLAEELEVNSRTIRRDIEFMRDRLDLPVEWDPALNAFRYTEDVGSFPTMQISEGELFALLVAEKALQQYRGTPFEKPLVAALRKIQEGLPDTVTVELANWEHAISFKTTAAPDLDLGLMHTIAESVQKRRRLALKYRKPNSKAPEARTVDPYHLTNVNGDWYLIAHDHLRNGIRTFAAARIIEAKPTGEAFPKPRGFHIEKELGGSFGIHSREGDFDVRIEVDASIADYIREKKWHPSQTITERPDGGLELRLRLGSLREIERWVLGWAGAARVTAPPELADAVGRAAAHLARTHPPRSKPA